MILQKQQSFASPYQMMRLFWKVVKSLHHMVILLPQICEGFILQLFQNAIIFTTKHDLAKVTIRKFFLLFFKLW